MTEAENQPSTAERRASRVHSSIGSKLYLDSASADVTFIVGRNDERVPAHKLLLTTASEVFETMFNGSWKEQDEVRIVDATAASFKEFLQFFYLDEVELTMENIKDVMNLGEKYDVNECLDLCVDFLVTKLTDDNVCWAYELAILFEHKRLRKFCELMISMNTKQMFQTTSFAECEREIVHEILSLNALNCTEAELFEAVMTWIKMKSKKNELTKRLIRTHLGDYFGVFRFGSMSIEEFSTLVPSYGKIFSNEEYQDIIQTIASPVHISKYFSDNREKRSEQTMWNDKDVRLFNRSYLTHMANEPYFIADIETAVFSTNKPVVLCGFDRAKLYNHSGGEYESMNVRFPTRITILQCADRLIFNEENSVVLHTEETELKRMNSLSKGILLKPGSTYQMRCEQRVAGLAGTLCTAVVLKPELNIKPSITIRFHDDPTVEGNDVARGLFQSFKFAKI